MDTLLHPINDISGAPAEDTYILLNLNGGSYYIHKNKFSQFSQLWLHNHLKIPLCVKLDSLPYHSIMFDIDFKGKPEDYNVTTLSEAIDNFETALKLLFLPQLKHFTIIYTKRRKSHGIHLHLPEFVIANDDYVLLCQHLQSSLIYTHYELDIPTNFMLPNVGKSDDVNDAYEPVKMKFLSESDSSYFHIKDFAPVGVSNLKNSFKRIKSNSESCFRKVLFIQPTQFKSHVLQLMMPLVQVFPPCWKCSYPTIMSSKPNESQDTHQNVAAYTNCLDEGKQGFILKSNQLTFDGKHFLKTFYYFRYNAMAIQNLETNNPALKAWHKRFKTNSIASPSCHPAFTKINQLLQIDNINFTGEANPLKKIMQYKRGYYLVPVFFTLVKILDMTVAEIIMCLKNFLDDEYLVLLNRLEVLNSEHVKMTTRDLTINTIYFCANNICAEAPKTFQDKLSKIVKDSQHSIMSVTTSTQMVDLVKKLQARHLPMRVLKLNSSTSRKSLAYVWNALADSWQEMNSDKERAEHISNLWFSIRTFINEYKSSGGFGGPESEIVDKFSINNVVTSLASDANMEVKTIVMDSHKWLVKMEDGCLLDLLTGHIGGNVPEFYMSNRTFDIRIPRLTLLKYLDEAACPLAKLYSCLTGKKFFKRYLKELLLDATDDLYDTARELVLEEFAPEFLQYPHAESMLRFYVHFCKFVSFEYDLLLYLLDILASTLIATNYKRNFFVVMGDTNNGKSMLFEILGQVFGNYFVGIQSDNLKKSGKSESSAPSPDLALTLFTCRVVVMEELEGNFNENRIKQITGMNRCAFRTVFKESQSAVPTAKIFVTTNNLPNCTATDAFRQRVVTLPFNSTFTENAPKKSSEQVMQCLYPKEEYVIESSYNGCFFTMYYHLRKNISLKNGYIHYREMPEIVKEYTKKYLMNTDVYNQFKTVMDVQCVPGSMTTMTDLESAIRQFLNTTKNHTALGAELKIKFEKEFGKYRQTDTELVSSFTGIFTAAKKSSSESLKMTNEKIRLDLDEEEEEEEDDSSDKDEQPPSKRTKSSVEEQTCTAVFYENVYIKNLRKSVQYDN